MITIDYTTHRDADVEIRSYSQHLALPAGPTPEELPPADDPTPEEPPPDVRNVLLWRQARHNQRTHDYQQSDGEAPACRFCGTAWPCDPRLNADEALAASFTSAELQPSHHPPTPPRPLPPALPKRRPRIVGVAPVIVAHPDWFHPHPHDSLGQPPLPAEQPRQ